MHVTPQNTANLVGSFVWQLQPARLDAEGWRAPFAQSRELITTPESHLIEHAKCDVNIMECPAAWFPGVWWFLAASSLPDQNPSSKN